MSKYQISGNSIIKCKTRKPSASEIGAPGRKGKASASQIPSGCVTMTLQEAIADILCCEGFCCDGTQYTLADLLGGGGTGAISTDANNLITAGTDGGDFIDCTTILNVDFPGPFLDTNITTTGLYATALTIPAGATLMPGSVHVSLNGTTLFPGDVNTGYTLAGTSIQLTTAGSAVDPDAVQVIYAVQTDLC